MIRGIDVYDGQGDIDWPQVFASGITFAIIKATEATRNVQSTFAANRANAPASGISPLGLYHFGRPENGDPEAQADHFCDVVGQLGDDEFLELDIETGDMSTWGDFSARFWAQVNERIGPLDPRRCGDYLSDWPSSQMSALVVPDQASVNGETQRLPNHGMRGRTLATHLALREAAAMPPTMATHPLWDAGYGLNTGQPPAWGKGYEQQWATQPFEHSWATGPWSTWTIWQFTSVGRVPGIGGGQVNVDCNLAPDDLRARLGLTQPPNPPQPPKEPDVSKVAYPLAVQSGESRTLPILVIAGGFAWTKVSVTFGSQGVDVLHAIVGPNERPIPGLAPEGVETAHHFGGRGYIDLQPGDEWIVVDLAPSPVGTLDLYVEASDAPA